MGVIKVDFRKKCRRNNKDTHCPAIQSGIEQSVLGLCTAVELLIATRVFGIEIKSTIAFSQSIACHEGGVDTILGWDTALLGTLHRIPWHPRMLFSLLSPSVACENAMLLIKEFITPAMSSIAEATGSSVLPVDDYTKPLLMHCQNSNLPSMRRTFNVTTNPSGKDSEFIAECSMTITTGNRFVLLQTEKEIFYMTGHLVPGLPRADSIQSGHAYTIYPLIPPQQYSIRQAISSTPLNLKTGRFTESMFPTLNHLIDRLLVNDTNCHGGMD